MASQWASPVSKVAWFALCLMINPACSRPGVVHRTEATANSPAGEQNLPFHQNPDHATDDSAHPAVPPDRKSGSGIPFPAALHPRSLPAGTLITVWLDSSLSIAKVRPGDTFTATVAGPLAVDGNRLIERGTPVSGRIEAAQPSVERPGLSPDPGYVRLALKTITIEGKTLDLETSSLFAKGTFQSGRLSGASSRRSGAEVRSGDLRIYKGRRLTFRLTAPLSFADPNPDANRQYSQISNE